MGAHVWYLGINNQKKPFDDKRVRQALNYAVNKEAIVRDVLKGTGAVSAGPVLPNTWGAEAALKAYPVRPGARKKLLAEAGYPNGFSTTLWVPESGSGMQSPVAMSTVIQSNLRAVGVNVTLQTMEWGAFLAKLRSKEQDLFALSWMAGTEDPDLVMYPLLHSSQWTPGGPNRALYKNTRFDELLHQARLVTDQAKRAELYREAQRVLRRRPAVDLHRPRGPDRGVLRRVQGFKLHPSFDLRVETISLNAEPAAGRTVRRYLARRLLLLVPVLLGGVGRRLPRAAPVAGGPGRDHARLAGDAGGPGAPARRAGPRRAAAVQYVRWLGHVLQGDLGRSLWTKRPVLREVLDRLRATLLLTAPRSLLSTIGGIALGVALGHAAQLVPRPR